jgi:hypothetical protein
MSDLLQRARDIAADQYIRLSMKKPTDQHGFAFWAAHVERYSGFLRDGGYDHHADVQTALAALRSVAA